MFQLLTVVILIGTTGVDEGDGLGLSLGAGAHLSVVLLVVDLVLVKSIWIGKVGKIDENGSVFFTIFVSPNDASSPSYPIFFRYTTTAAIASTRRPTVFAVATADKILEQVVPQRFQREGGGGITVSTSVGARGGGRGGRRGRRAETRWNFSR